MRIPDFIEKSVSLAPYTSFKIGGPADYFGLVRNISELKEAVGFALDRKIPVFVLGKGTNILVSDSGFRGLVLRLSGEFTRIFNEGRVIVAGGGAQTAMAASLAYRASLSGLEWSAGIPGTVGGAVRMNAGAHGFSIKDILVDITVYDVKSEELVKLKEEEPKHASPFPGSTP